MIMDRQSNSQFELVASHVQTTASACHASGSAVLIIHHDKVVCEQYWGRFSESPFSKPIEKSSPFLVASVRKCYIGFAAAYAIVNGHITSIDDEVSRYMPELDARQLQGTTIRHLLTHTHGLHEDKEGRIVRKHPPGRAWEYRGLGVGMLCQIIHRTTGRTISEILHEEVFLPLGFQESGWFALPNDRLVDVIRDPNSPHWTASDDLSGSKMNMYVSTQELAYWGYLHLTRGLINGRQIASPEVFDLAVSLQSPDLLDVDSPQNGFLWFVKDRPAKKNEIGDLVPRGSYQILGFTGVTLLVIPEKRAVAVRMFNSFGSPSGFDYLKDVREFGDVVTRCLSNFTSPLL
jgi:CubicO group peptidase (beta-lactamase class C family)